MQDLLTIHNILGSIESELEKVKEERDSAKKEYIEALKRAKKLTEAERLFIAASEHVQPTPGFNGSGFSMIYGNKFTSLKLMIQGLSDTNKNLQLRCDKLTDTLLRELNHERDC
jgi:hypothetical protein